MIWGIALKKFIRHGRLTVIDARGNSHVFGAPDAMPQCAIRLHDKSLHWKLLINPELYLGEAYMDGGLTIENDSSLKDFLTVFGINMQDGPRFFWEEVEFRLRPVLNLILQYNTLKRAKENVVHHYDLSEEMYRLFLDDDMQYSCAYFTDPNNSLYQAQMDKKKHIAAKLLLKPGMKVLEIGCGWGGLALFLAKEYGVYVTALTISEEQHRVAMQRAKDSGLQDKVQFILKDYREEAGLYDRVVSIAMFENVGTMYYSEYFKIVKNRLKAGGIALIHSIGRMDQPDTTNPWLRKYIFPGGYVPALSEVFPATEKQGLWITDVEILRMHYAYTLTEWHNNFQKNRVRISELYDERFCRMWEFYLLLCDMFFRYCGIMVFQLQLTKTIDAVPITRDYMIDHNH